MSGEQLQTHHGHVYRYDSASFANADAIRATAVRYAKESKQNNVVAVIPAMHGVDGALQTLGQTATERRSGDIAQVVDALFSQHREAIRQLGFEPGKWAMSIGRLASSTHYLSQILEDIAYDGMTPAKADKLAAWGPSTVVPIFASAVEQEGVNAVPLVVDNPLVTTPHHRNARVLMRPTRNNIQTTVLPILESGRQVILPGGIGFRSDNHHISRLGKNGEAVTTLAIAKGLYPRGTKHEIIFHQPGIEVPIFTAAPIQT